MIEIERHLPHSVERVWRAISEPAELAQWFVAPVSWTPAVGETIDAFGQTGEVTEVEPPRTLAWTYGVERYRFELEPDGEGCRLRFFHLPDPSRGPEEQHRRGWLIYFGRLDGHLEGRPVGEIEAHVALLEEGPSVRLERHLDAPVERVWRALTEPAELAHWFPDGMVPEVVADDPPRMVAWDFHGDRVRVDLEPDGDGCLLRLTHAFDEREVAARNAAGWDRCLARLKALLAGTPMDEAASLRDWPEVHEMLAERWGLDPEVGRRAYAQHPAT